MPVDASVRESGVPATDYYAPNFKVEVEGRELDPEAKGDVLDVKVTMDLDNLTSFDLTINNWDDKRFAFKYSDTTIFDVGNRVHVRMGYADDLRFMASGLISTLTPKFPESGSPTLGVTGVDAMLKLRDRKPVGSDVKKFVDRTDWQIAQEIAALSGPRRQELQQTLDAPLPRKSGMHARSLPELTEAKDRRRLYPVGVDVKQTRDTSLLE